MSSELESPSSSAGELLTREQRKYVCPGEESPISRSIHLARLAAFFPTCRECPHRHDTGHLPAKTIEHLEETQKRIRRADLFTDEGIRGVYLNEIDSNHTRQVIEAFSALVLEKFPRKFRAKSEVKRTRTAGPHILVGHDSRSSSFHLVASVVGTLKKMGCSVTEIGLSSRPSFCFAAAHWKAIAGIYVTGSGCEPSWTGFDFVGGGAVPLSSGLSLDGFRIRLERQVCRPTRQGGTLNSFHAAVPYRANLWKSFQNLTPLGVVCGVSDPFTKSTLCELSAKLPCRLETVDLPIQRSDRLQEISREVIPVVQTMKNSQATLGAIVEQDGMKIRFIDELGAVLPTAYVVRLLTEGIDGDTSESPIVLTDSLKDAMAEKNPEFVERSVSCDSTMEAMYRAMNEFNADFGADEFGRYWFRDTVPVCDAVKTLGAVLQSIGRIEKTISELYERIGDRDPLR